MNKKAKRQIFHNFNGKVYEIVWRNLKYDYGRCDAPSSEDGERFIILSSFLKKAGNKELCETLIHEALHAEQWYLDEETVQRIGESITDLLEKFNLIKTDTLDE